MDIFTISQQNAGFVAAINSEFASPFDFAQGRLHPNAVDAGFARRSGRDCRNPEAMEGSLHSPPCVLDTGNPCRYDGCVNSNGASSGLRGWAWALRLHGLYRQCADFHCLGLGKAIKLPKQSRIIYKARRHVGVVDS